ncbi:MAG: GDSL-type esterase/lipase family protein [Litorimonas sp.]
MSRRLALSAILLGAALLMGGPSHAQDGAPADCVPRAALDAYVQRSIDRKADVYASLPMVPGRTLFVGSSLIEEGPWRALLGDDAVNRGISAETTHDLLGRIGALAAERPARIFLYTGGNNLSRRGETADQAVSGVAAVLSALKDASPETTIHLSTLLPREAEHAEAVRAVNSGLVSLAAERGVALIDVHADFSDGTGALRPEFTNDGIHLNAHGYALWAALIEQGLATPSETQ